MAWARVDDSWWCHPKVLGLSMAARGVWMTALSWSCQMRRDVVPASFVGMVADPDVLGVEKELVSAGLWVEVEGGWRIHDWDKYQQQSLSEKRSEAGAKGGRKSRPPKQPGSKTEATGKQNEVASPSKVEATGEAGTRPVPSQPTPKENPVSTEVDAEDPDFTAFWFAYPARNGKKLNKAKALKAFNRIAKARRPDLAVAVKHYAAACNGGTTIAKDAFRWLQPGVWDDWLTPATPPRVGARPPDDFDRTGTF